MMSAFPFGGSFHHATRTKLFGMTLGIVSPWEVNEITFSKESNRLDIYIDFQKGAQFPCPVCGKLSPVPQPAEHDHNGIPDCWKAQL